MVRNDSKVDVDFKQIEIMRRGATKGWIITQILGLQRQSSISSAINAMRGNWPERSRAEG